MICSRPRARANHAVASRARPGLPRALSCLRRWLTVKPESHLEGDLQCEEGQSGGGGTVTGSREHRGAGGRMEKTLGAPRPAWWRQKSGPPRGPPRGLPSPTLHLAPFPMHQTTSDRNLHVMAILGYLFFPDHTASRHFPQGHRGQGQPLPTPTTHPPTHLLPRKQTHARLFSVGDGVPLCLSKHKTHVHSVPALRYLHRAWVPGFFFNQHE